jgi:hypothetical protein
MIKSQAARYPEHQQNPTSRNPNPRSLVLGHTSQSDGKGQVIGTFTALADF